jgi:dihydrofolate reductase
LFDVVLMGRRTYEVGLKEGITNPYPQMKQYLFYRTMTESSDKNVELVSTKPFELIRELKTQIGKDIWLCGGGDLATALFTEIDEMILKVNPLLLGLGIPLFSGIIQQKNLELIDSKIYNNGFMLLHYRIKH